MSSPKVNYPSCESGFYFRITKGREVIHEDTFLYRTPQKAFAAGTEKTDEFSFSDWRLMSVWHKSPQGRKRRARERDQLDANAIYTGRAWIDW